MTMPILILMMLLMMPLVASGEDEKRLTIESWGNGAPELTISVPIGYTVEKQKGPDFDVHYVTSKDPYAVSMGIYIGHHAHPFGPQKKEIETRKETDAILGQNVEWVFWQEERDGEATYHCETIVSEAFKGMGGGGVAGLRVHVFIKGPEAKNLNSLMNSARSLRIAGGSNAERNSQQKNQRYEGFILIQPGLESRCFKSALHQKDCYWVDYGPDISTKVQKAINEKMIKLDEVTEAVWVQVEGEMESGGAFGHLNQYGKRLLIMKVINCASDPVKKYRAEETNRGEIGRSTR
jgi:hypothetical protein